MTENPVNEAMSRILTAEDGVEREMALGELLERLVRAAGQPAHRLGVAAAAVMLLWRASESGEEDLLEAQEAVKAMLGTARPDVLELSRLAAVGRALLGAALAVQGEQLLAATKKADAGYVPEEGDWAIWLGKHVVRVKAVSRATLVDGYSHEDHIDSVLILTAGQQTLPVSPESLELYRRDGEGPPGDFGLASR